MHEQDAATEAPDRRSHAPQIGRAFVYHPPKPDQFPRYEAIRAKARELAELIDASCPYTREKSLALTHLQECTMWANAAIACNE